MGGLLVVDTRRLITLEKCRKYIVRLQTKFVFLRMMKKKEYQFSYTNDGFLFAATLFLVTLTLRTRNCYVLVT